MENVFKEACNALLVTITEDGGDRTWNGGRFGCFFFFFFFVYKSLCNKCIGYTIASES